MFSARNFAAAGRSASAAAQIAAVDAGAHAMAATILEDLDRQDVSKAAVHKTGLGVYLNVKVSKMPVAKVSARALRICNKWRALFFAPPTRGPGRVQGAGVETPSSADAPPAQRWVEIPIEQQDWGFFLDQEAAHLSSEERKETFRQK